MASAVVRSNCQTLLRRILTSRNGYNSIRQITTSKKNKEGVAVTACPPQTESKYVHDFSDPKKSIWRSYGFDEDDIDEDRYTMHVTFFIGVTLCMVVGGFYFTYQPDLKSQNWAHREGFLELRRREELGLPIIDKNYVDESKIVLPTDEELGDTEIII